MPLEYEECSDDEFIGSAEDEIEVEAAADTGAVAHCSAPKHLPGSISVVQSKDGRVRNFVGAGGEGIKRYGEAQVVLEQENGNLVNTTVQVAEVCRSLHSVSQICDAKHEMLFTDREGVVVPAGTFAKLLATAKIITRYPRKGGLYVAKMKARNPAAEKTSGFRRQGMGR